MFDMIILIFGVFIWLVQKKAVPLCPLSDKESLGI